MDSFLTIDNLIDVVRILHTHFPNYTIYIELDKFNVNILKFVHNTQLKDFEVILTNNFDCKLNKRGAYKINIKHFTALFRQAMISVCGQKYADALKNYARYEKKIKIEV